VSKSERKTAEGSSNVDKEAKSASTFQWSDETPNKATKENRIHAKDKEVQTEPIIEVRDDSKKRKTETKKPIDKKEKVHQ